jgi:hypothetical protein
VSRQIPFPSPLAELLARDGELDRITSGQGLTFLKPLGSDGPPRQPVYLPPVD